MRQLGFAMILAAIAAPALAECPATPPSYDWVLAAGDQSLSGAELTQLLVGRKVTYYSGAVETYAADGSYSYRDGRQLYEAPAVAFYPEGLRCVDYPLHYRFDRYVESQGKLIRIDVTGNRYEGQIGQ